MLLFDARSADLQVALRACASHLRIRLSIAGSVKVGVGTPFAVLCAIALCAIALLPLALISFAWQPHPLVGGLPVL